MELILNAPTLQSRQLFLFDLMKARVAEGADEGILCQPFAQGKRLETANASTQMIIAAAHRLDVPCDEEWAGGRSAQ